MEVQNDFKMKESRQGDIADVIKNKHAVDRRLSTADGGGAIGQVRRHSISRRLRTTSLCRTPSNARRSLTNADETRRANCARSVGRSSNKLLTTCILGRRRTSAAH